MNKIENVVSMLGLVNLHQNVVLINGLVGFFVFPRIERFIVWAQDWAQSLML